MDVLELIRTAAAVLNSLLDLYRTIRSDDEEE